ncbi:hypothetical protein P20311_3281 [Pseudoalteromonas sp. BSi20311]|nr:hypothetical protein P20311_3281 [Pseudoalteromonas sp. BSi20311]GAA71865.1 hypothetical protein P20439_1946 [Pseudoalteromonas sp. BSi20439]
MACHFSTALKVLLLCTLEDNVWLKSNYLGLKARYHYR